MMERIRLLPIKNFPSAAPREWRYRSNPYSSSAITDPEKNSLILLQYATNMGRGADSREIVYLRTPKFDCNANKTQQPKYKKNSHIFFEEWRVASTDYL